MKKEDKLKDERVISPAGDDQAPTDNDVKREAKEPKAEKPAKAPYAHLTQAQRDAHFFEDGVDEYGKTQE